MIKMIKVQIYFAFKLISITNQLEDRSIRTLEIFCPDSIKSARSIAVTVSITTGTLKAIHASWQPLTSKFLVLPDFKLMIFCDFEMLDVGFMDTNTTHNKNDLPDMIKSLFLLKVIILWILNQLSLLASFSILHFPFQVYQDVFLNLDYSYFALLKLVT